MLHLWHLFQLLWLVPHIQDFSFHCSSKHGQDFQITTINLPSQVTDLTNKVFTCRIFLVWKILLIYLGLQKLIPLQNVPRNGYGKFKHSVWLNFQIDYTFYPSVALSCLKYKNLYAKDVSCSALNLKLLSKTLLFKNIYMNEMGISEVSIITINSVQQCGYISRNLQMSLLVYGT